MRALSQEVALSGFKFTFTFEGAGATGIWGTPAPGAATSTQALPGADLTVTGQQGSPTGSGGLLIALSDDEFLVAGTGIVVTVECEDSPGLIAGILWAQEGEFVDGRWVPGRWLNGDQTHQGRHIRIPPGEIGMQRFRLYRYR